MHGPAKRWMAAAGVAAAVLFGGASSVSAQGAGGAAGAAPQRPPDPPAIAYRKAMMQANAQHMNALRALLAGGLNHPDDVKKHADAMEKQGEMFEAMWPEGSTGPESRAKDEIWSMKDDFAAKLKAFKDATHELDETAEKGENGATLAAVTAVNATCGACHMSYRKPAPPPPPR